MAFVNAATVVAQTYLVCIAGPEKMILSSNMFVQAAASIRIINSFIAINNNNIILNRKKMKHILTVLVIIVLIVLLSDTEVGWGILLVFVAAFIGYKFFDSGSIKW